MPAYNLDESRIRTLVRNYIDPLLTKFRQEIYGSGTSYNSTVNITVIPDLEPKGYIKGIKTYISSLLLGTTQTEISISGAGTTSVGGSVVGSKTYYVISGGVGPAGGDLSGTYPNPIVDGLQGVAISATTPAAGQALTYNGSQWAPSYVPRVIAGWYFSSPIIAGSGTNDFGPVYQIDAPVTISGLWGNSNVTATATNTFDVAWSTDLVNWESIYSVKPTITSGNRTNTRGTLSKTTLAADDFVRFGVASIGGVTLSGVTMQLRVYGR